MENPLVGDGFGPLGSPIKYRATMEPSATMSRNQGAKIPDERVGFYRTEGWGPAGYPIDRSKKEEEKD